MLPCKTPRNAEKDEEIFDLLPKKAAPFGGIQFQGDYFFNGLEDFQVKVEDHP